MGIFFRGLGIVRSSNNCLILTDHAGILQRRILVWVRREEEPLTYRREDLKYNIKNI